MKIPLNSMLVDSSDKIEPSIKLKKGIHLCQENKGNLMGIRNESSEILRNSISGGISGLLTFTITCPIEVLQSRLQTTIDSERIKKVQTPLFRNSSFLKYFNLPGFNFRNKYFVVAKDIYINDGLVGFYKGYAPMVVGIIPSRSVYFATNFFVRQHFNNYFGNDYETAKVAVSAISGSLAASTLTCPVWVTKTNMQLKRHLRVKKYSVREVVTNIYKTNGISGFYRGLSSSYYGSIETMTFWVMYESFKKKLIEFENNDKQLTTWQNAKAAGLAKLLSLLIGYPHEVARTRMRQSLRDNNGGLIYREFWSTLSKIAREEGFSRLYSGLSAQILRQVPNSAILLVLFEKFQTWFNNPYLSEVDV